MTITKQELATGILEKLSSAEGKARSSQELHRQLTVKDARRTYAPPIPQFASLLQLLGDNELIAFKPEDGFTEREFRYNLPDIQIQITDKGEGLLTLLKQKRVIEQKIAEIIDPKKIGFSQMTACGQGESI